MEASGEHRGTVQKNISKCRSDISGNFRRTPWHCAKWLRNSPDKCYQRIRICLVGEVEMPSSPIRRQATDVKYPDGMSAEKNSGCETSGEGGTSQGLSGATPSGFPKRTRSALPYPNSLREKHTARTPSGFSLHSGFAYGKGLQSFSSSCF
uniref:Uncharacterized protein n=1 Tax=Vitis vinifera TaxID=29760 RepID=A5BXM4_VITVI|nr:hypothetical protein VITISV_030275 [Vitis vinifera]